MRDTIESFWNRMRGLRVAFIGVGVSNNDCIRLFRARGVEVTVCDRKTRDKAPELFDEFERLGCRLRLGDGYLDGLEREADVAFRAPGLYFLKPELTALRQAGVAVTSELEVFFSLCPCPVYAVTGSDGKTTTTTLTAKLLESVGKRVFLGGNIGRALLPQIEEVRAEDVAVVELSSFQLMSLRFAPDVSVVLNVTPNHLDVHKNMEEYIGAKKQIMQHQDAFSRTVLNADDPVTRGFLKDVRGLPLTYSTEGAVERGAWLDADDKIWMRNGGEPVRVMDASEVVLPGRHFLSAYLAAISATMPLIPVENIRSLARTFRGVEHRIEFCRELDGARWYNDSIGTSPSRTIAGLRSFTGRVVLIAGGYDKHIPYEPLAPEICGRVCDLILMGATGPKIEAAVRADASFDPALTRIHHAPDMESAVALARACTPPAQVVLFSPASASFDLYPNFEARGKHFKSIVEKLH